jgi:hypothetical protein
MLQQRGLSPSLCSFTEALLRVQALSLLKKIFSKTLRNEEMTPRHNAYSVMTRMPDTVIISKAHQPEYKLIAQCGSYEQSSELLETNVDVVHMPLLIVSS